MGHPIINDISTDRAQPPVFLTSPPKDGRYDAASLVGPTEQAYGDLVNLHVTQEPEAVFLRVRHLVEQRQWQVTAVEAERWRIQAVATTRFLRFKDDVVIQVRTENGEKNRGEQDQGGSVVVMRSKSRLGKGDLGTNAKRIRAFLNDLSQFL